MSEFRHPLLEDPRALASFEGWSEQVYRDFLALQRGTLSAAEFDARYRATHAILILDLTGFTLTATRSGPLHSLLRVFDAQKVCIPVLQEGGASLIRTFADDIVALFDEPAPALDAAFEIHHRVAHFNRSGVSGPDPADCCIGVGYGSVYTIGPNRAMGDEVNRTSKLGEDTARGGETLVTENLFESLRHRDDVRYERQAGDDQLFPYYRATPRTSGST